MAQDDNGKTAIRRSRIRKNGCFDGSERMYSCDGQDHSSVSKGNIHSPGGAFAPYERKVPPIRVLLGCRSTPLERNSTRQKFSERIESSRRFLPTSTRARQLYTSRENTAEEFAESTSVMHLFMNILSTQLHLSVHVTRVVRMPTNVSQARGGAGK